MAFKKRTHSPEEMQAIFSAQQDARIFGDLKISNGTVDLQWDRRYEHNGDVTAVGNAKDGTEFLIHFKGKRAKIFKAGLHECIQRIWEKTIDLCHEESRAYPESCDHSITVNLEGIWTPIYWTKDGKHGTEFDDTGVQRKKSWEFIAARWLYQDPISGGKVILEGNLPFS
jgi:hypothetical protein